MKLYNPWIGYLQRSYLDIKNTMLDRLGKKVPELSDHSESNPLVIILSMFAGVTETINYYIDNMARESFITTARKYSSVVKLTRLIDYRIKAAVPSSVDITITFKDGENSVAAGVDFTIPLGTIFISTVDNIPFISTKTIEVYSTDTQVIVPTEQKRYVQNVNLGQTSGLIDSTYLLPDNYVHNSLQLKVGGDNWGLVNTLGTQGSNSEVYIVEISTDKQAYIKFGDNTYGKLPTTGQTLIGSYFETYGEQGNLEKDNISTISLDIPVGAKFNTFNVTNTTPSTGGSSYESIESIRRSAPLHLRTLDRAVTKTDYEDIAKLAPGVDKALVQFSCGKTIYIYITPTGGGIASSTLLDRTYDYLDERKMVGTPIDVNPAGESYIKINIDVYGKFRKDPLVVKQEVIEELTDKYSYENSDINKKIRLSDLYAIVDNLSSVDYLNIESLYIVPYFRPIGNSSPLNPVITIEQGSEELIKWIITYQSGKFILIKDGLFIDTITPNELYKEVDNIFTIIIPNATYKENDKWEFTTYPRENNLEINDFSVPIIREEDITINVHEQIVN